MMHLPSKGGSVQGTNRQSNRSYFGCGRHPASLTDGEGPMNRRLGQIERHVCLSSRVGRFGSMWQEAPSSYIQYHGDSSEMRTSLQAVLPSVAPIALASLVPGWARATCNNCHIHVKLLGVLYNGVSCAGNLREMLLESSVVGGGEAHAMGA